MRKYIILSVSLIVLITLAAIPAFAAPAASGDPACSGSLPPLLSVGATGRIAERYSTLRTSPGGPGVQIFAPATFTVTGSPVCAGGLWNWPITYTSGAVGSGWAVESEVNSVYGPNRRWLVPVGTTATPTPTVTPAPVVTVTPPVVAPTSCALSLPTAFAGTGAATSGRINERFSTLRTAPGSSSGVRVMAPAAFTVTGQTCFHGLSYVTITYTSGVTAAGASAVGLSGWALESQTYFDGLYGPGRWLVP